MINKIFLFYLLLASTLLLQGCDSAKKALGGGKIKSSDEFLVEKKDPLVLPPEFNKLPEPKNANDFILEEVDYVALTWLINTSKFSEKNLG